MRDLRLLDTFRDRVSARRIWSWEGDETCGCFQITSPVSGQRLAVVASSGDGWDHVSVSLPNRCPNWPEMDYIKRLFFKDDEAAMQLHVPMTDHINVHPHCLHIWRPQNAEIPRPPGWMVAPKAKEPT